MLHPIVRLYETAAKAEEVVARLKGAGLTSDLINLVTPHLGKAGEGAEAASEDAVLAAILRGYVLKADAKGYAKRVVAGRSLVSVHAPFGTGEATSQLLDSYGPVERELSERRPTWDEGAPFSSVLGAPTLSADPTPFSTFWHIPVLARSAPTSNITLGSSKPTTEGLGLPMLSSEPAPFSSMFKIPTILK